MMKDAVAYMKWERIVAWKVLSLIENPDQPPVPLGFGSRDRAFPRMLAKGSQIWVIVRIAGVRSLAGRVTVRNIVDKSTTDRSRWPKEVVGLLRQWPFVAVAQYEHSRFFEANSAEAALQKHDVRFAQHRAIVYRDGPLLKSFKSCIDQAQNVVFLSYRWNEGRRFAKVLAREFRKRGWSPWLDALSIPEYEDRGEPGVTKNRLRKLLRFGIEGARFAVVINTATFRRSAWTRMELASIRRTGMPWYQVLRDGAEFECDQPPISMRNPAAVAEEALRRYAVVA